MYVFLRLLHSWTMRLLWTCKKVKAVLVAMRRVGCSWAAVEAGDEEATVPSLGERGWWLRRRVVRGSMNQGWLKSHPGGLGWPTGWRVMLFEDGNEQTWWDQALRCTLVQVSGHSREKPAFVDSEFFYWLFIVEFQKHTQKFFWYEELETHHPVWPVSPFYLTFFFCFLSNFISTLSPGVSVLFFKLLSRLSDVLSFYQ